MKKHIKIQFTDFWDDFDKTDNFITDALLKNFEIEWSEQPDFVFCSIFGNRHLRYDCVKIFFTGENLSPDFNLVDYAIGFHHIIYDDRYLRFPLYVLYQDALDAALKKHLNTNSAYLSHQKFCNYVISNAISDHARDQMIEVLNSYQTVDSGGRYRNNVGGPVPDKIAFEKGYQFTMCFENTSSRGYTTEKIIEAFAGETIPIYWGNPDIAKEFNPESFVNCHDFASFEEVLNEVKRIHSNQELFLSKVKAPILLEDSIAAKYLDENYLSDFLMHICEQAPSQAIRRNTIYHGARYEKRAKFHQGLDQILYYPNRAAYFLHNRLAILKKGKTSS